MSLKFPTNVPYWNFLTLSTTKMMESNLLIVLAKVAFLFWICFSIKIHLRTCCNFPPSKSLLTKYPYIPYESFHPSSNKKAFIKGELIRYARNSSSFNSFSETRDKFWKRLRVRGYPFRFLLPLFREIRYSDRKKWLCKKPKNRSSLGRTIVFKTTFNCSHARIKSAISTILPELDCTVCYQKTVTLANLCK